MTEFERFCAKFTVGNRANCWLWHGAKMKDGYGNFKAAGRFVRAHRYAYELLVGPIPEGLVLDHLCRVPLCVNPSHLEPVTRRENVLRGETVAASNAAKTHCKKGHPLSGDNLYEHGHSRHCRVCRLAALERARLAA